MQPHADTGTVRIKVHPAGGKLFSVALGEVRFLQTKYESLKESLLEHSYVDDSNVESIQRYLGVPKYISRAIAENDMADEFRFDPFLASLFWALSLLGGHKPGNPSKMHSQEGTEDCGEKSGEDRVDIETHALFTRDELRIFISHVLDLNSRKHVVDLTEPPPGQVKLPIQRAAFKSATTIASLFCLIVQYTLILNAVFGFPFHNQPMVF